VNRAARLPAPDHAALDEIISDLQHLIEANETTHLLVREASEQLGEALLLHLDDVDALICALKGKVARLGGVASESETILIIGGSPLARAVLPRLLSPLRCMIVSTDDVLCAVHVLERLRVDYIVADANAEPLGAAALAALRTRIPNLGIVPMFVLPAADEQASVDELMALCSAALRREDVASADADAFLPALLACMERVAA
jgi:hypothetical protein